LQLKLAYLILTAITVVFLIIIGFRAIENSSSRIKKDKLILVLGLLLWQLFIFIVSSTDILKSYEFPPRFAIAFIIPSFVFTGVYLYLNKSKDWIKSIPEEWIIYFQSFRILVETLFVLSLPQKIFNYHVTIKGYNFDMIFALSAPIIAYLVFNRKIISRKIILYWNYLGVCVLVSVIVVFLTSMYKPEIYGSNIPLLPLESMKYPYVLIAGFLMPTAIFLHILSIIQAKTVEPRIE
jgi:hypothetical protein